MSFGKSSTNSSEQTQQNGTSNSTSTPNNLPYLQAGWGAAESALNGNNPAVNSALSLLTNNAGTSSTAANNGLNTAANYAAPGGTTNAANGYLTPFANGSMSGNNPYFQNLVNQISQSVQGSTDGGFAAAGRYGSGANANAFNTAMANEAGQLGYANYGDSLNRQLTADSQLSNNNTASTTQALTALGLVPGLTSASTNAGTAAYNAAAAPNNTYANILALLGSGGGTANGTESQTGSTTGSSNTAAGGLSFSNLNSAVNPGSILSMLGL